MLAALALSLTTAVCHGPLPGDPSRALPGRIQLTGSQQSAVVGTTVTTPPSLQVWSRGGEPMPNLRVVFAVTGGGGAVTAATVSTDLDGIATVGSWTLGTQAGVNALTVTVSEVDTVLVFMATGTPGAPTTITKVAGDTQTTTVGTLVTVAPTVRVADQYGNAVPRVGVTFAVASGGGSATGTSVVTDTVGRVAVGSWRLGAQPGSNALAATMDGSSIAGVTFTATATPLPAVKVGFAVQPSAVAAGAPITPALQVAVQDAQGNTVTSATSSITLAITSGAGVVGATLGGARTVTAVAGVATFPDLSLDRAGTGYTLTATATGLTSATSSSFVVATGAAARLGFTVQPAAVVAAGVTIAPALQVVVLDAFGNTVSGATNAITLAIASGTGSTGALLIGTLTQSAVAGVATFAGLSVDKAGTGYALTVVANGLTSATSTAFTVTPGVASKLAFGVQPSTVMAGVAITPSVKVAVQDALGNIVTSATTSISLAITSGTGAAGGVLGGATTAAAVSGVATFSSLTVDRSGTAYTLSATATGLGSATSGVFNVDLSSATKLAFTVEPADVTVGSSVSPAVRVAVQDALGTTVPITAAITLAITSGSGTAGAVLGGTLTQSAVSGFATFGNLTISQAGTAYTLAATASALTSATSAPFRVNAVPASLAIVAQPTDATVGATISPSVQVAVRDVSGNTVTSATNAVTIGIAAGSGTVGASLSGTLTRTPVNGIATFSGLAINRIGAGYTLSATATGLFNGVSTSFAIHGIATLLGVGSEHACAIAVGGLLYCWGSNSNGQLGDSTTASRSVPVAVRTSLTFSQVSSGSAAGHTCALTSTGSAYCWGYNLYGQLGDGSTASPRTSPVAVSGGLVLKAISAGSGHTCALTTSGAAYCWGSNSYGQLGDNTIYSRNGPVAVSGSLVFQAISAGAEHTCGLSTGGAAYCWGRNDYGQLGNGTTSGSPIPVLVTSNATFTQIGAGLFHTCAVTSAGVLGCWGHNGAGQLGDSTLTQRTTPVPVRSSVILAGPSGGGFHTCATASGGTAYCWGSGTWGQLGSGSYSDTGFLGAVSGSVAYSQVSAGDNFTCGLSPAGQVYCWGYSSHGQLGNGSSNYSTATPTRVSLF